MNNITKENVFYATGFTIVIAMVVVAVAIALTIGGAASPQTEKKCNEAGFHLGYDASFAEESKTCYITLEHGVTLPLSDALDAIKFLYTKSSVEETQKRVLMEDGR